MVLTIVCDTHYDVIMTSKEEEQIASMVDNLTQELRRGNLVLIVLSQLKSPQYGYSLMEVLTAHNLVVEAGTLYPLLRRLEGQGLLTSEWETSGSKPRKYYVLSDLGLKVLRSLVTQWKDLTNQMIGLLQGGVE